jgi:DNA-binding FadR family transcriptional regulator
MDRSQGPLIRSTASQAMRLADTVSAELARMIAAGTLPSGARLPTERELMRRFGVSRSAVREAIQGLAARGLLLTRPGHRPLVQGRNYEAAVDTLGRLVAHLVADETGVRNLFETRVFLEAALARHAALHARRDDIEALDAALQANHAAIGDPERFYATDAAFHALLYRMPRNPIFPEVHRAYVEWLQDHWRLLPRGAEFDRVNHAAHAEILAAIVERDPDAAEAALRRHLATAWEFLRAALRSAAPSALIEAVAASG